MLGPASGHRMGAPVPRVSYIIFFKAAPGTCRSYLVPSSAKVLVSECRPSTKRQDLQSDRPQPVCISNESASSLRVALYCGYIFLTCLSILAIFSVGGVFSSFRSVIFFPS